MKRITFLIILVILMSHGQSYASSLTNETIIKTEMENESSIYTVEELENLYLQNNASLDIEKFEATIRKYTLLNGMLDQSNLSAQIRKLEEIETKTLQQINQIDVLVLKDSSLPITNPEKLTDDEIQELENQIIADKTSKYEKEEVVNNYRKQLLLHETGTILLTDEEKDQILLDLDQKIFEIDVLEDSIMLAMITIQLDKYTSSENPYKMSDSEREELLNQRNDLMVAYSSYKNEIQSLNKQMILLKFQNVSGNIKNGFDEKVFEELKEKERIGFRVKILSLLENEYNYQLKISELEFYRDRLQTYEVGNRTGYVDNNSIKTTKDNISKIKRDLELYKKNVETGLINLEHICGLSDISQVVVPDKYFATRADLNDYNFYLKKYIENAYVFLYIDEQIEAYRKTEKELINSAGSFNDSRIIRAEGDKLYAEKKKMLTDIQQEIMKLISSYLADANEVEKYKIEVNEAKRQYETSNIKYNLGYTSCIDRDEKLFSYDQLLQGEKLYLLKLKYITTIFEGITKGILFQEM